MSREITMSFAHLKILHNSTLCAQIYCINSKFLTDVFYTQVCDGFEILENQMRSVAPSAVGNWEDALKCMCILGLEFFKRVLVYFFPAGTPCFTVLGLTKHLSAHALNSPCTLHLGRVAERTPCP